MSLEILYAKMIKYHYEGKVLYKGKYHNRSYSLDYNESEYALKALKKKKKEHSIVFVS